MTVLIPEMILIRVLMVVTAIRHIKAAANSVIKIILVLPICHPYGKYVRWNIYS